jgi:hypothetical protein
MVGLVDVSEMDCWPRRVAHACCGGSVAALLLTPSTALAYHERLGIGGGAPVHVLIVLAIAVIIALVLLSRWQPKKRGRKRASVSPPRPARKGKRR